VAEALPLDGIDVDLVELSVTAGLALANRRLRDMPDLAATLVAAVVRADRVVIPTGNTRILPGDVLLLVANREGDAVARLTAWARGEVDGLAPPSGDSDTAR
jgi:Trk K+ transport system NAD-binding subunit